MAQKVPSAGGELLVQYLQLGTVGKNRYHTCKHFGTDRTHWLDSHL